MRYTGSGFFGLDFLAPDLKLTFRGAYSFKTKIGVILSLVCLSISSILLFFIGSDYFDTSKPKVTQELIPLASQPSLNMKRDKKFPIVMLNFINGDPITKEELPKYFTIFMSHQSFNAKRAPIFKIFDMVPCADLVNEGRTGTIEISHEGIVKTNYLKYGYCVDPGDDEASLNLGGNPGDDEIVVFGIYPCMLGPQCKSKDEIKNLGYTVTVPKSYTNYGNYKNPVQYLTEKNEHEFVNFDVGLRQRYQFSKNTIYEFRGFLSGYSITNEFFGENKFSSNFWSRDRDQITCNNTDEMLRLSCVSYYSLELTVSSSSVKLTREYKGLIESVSEIGGMIELIMILFCLVYSFYHHSALEEEMVKEMYGFEKRSGWFLSSKLRNMCPKKENTKILNKLDQMSGIGADNFEVVNRMNGKERDQKILYRKATELTKNNLDIVEIAKDLLILRTLMSIILSDESKKILKDHHFKKIIESLKPELDSEKKVGRNDKDSPSKLIIRQDSNCFGENEPEKFGMGEGSSRGFAPFSEMNSSKDIPRESLFNRQPIPKYPKISLKSPSKKPPNNHSPSKKTLNNGKKLLQSSPQKGLQINHLLSPDPSTNINNRNSINNLSESSPMNTHSAMLNGQSSNLESVKRILLNIINEHASSSQNNSY